MATNKVNHAHLGTACARGMIPLPTPFDFKVESEWQSWVIAYAKALGWAVAHFRTVGVARPGGRISYQTPVQADGAGLPDLILVRERVVWAELKVGKNTLSDDQKVWISRLQTAACEVYVWYPADAAVVSETLRRETPECLDQRLEPPAPDLPSPGGTRAAPAARSRPKQSSP